MSDTIVVASVCVVILLVLLFSGIWVGVSLALVGVLGFLLSQGNVAHVSYIPTTVTNSFILTAVPLFLFMGEILVHCGAAEALYQSANRWLAWAPGGLLHANIGACTLFAAISGSSPATAATIGTVALPSLKRRGYDERLTLGSLAAGGTLGILIPPSIAMIIYGSLSESSIGMLFAGGITPGIMLSGMFMAYIGLRAIRNPRLAPKETAFSVRGLILSLKGIWPMLILMTIVLGGIFGGIMTPTEAAAVGSSAAMLIAVVMRRFNWQMVKESLYSALETTCMLMIIVVGASILSSYLAVMGVPKLFAMFVFDSGLPPVGILLLIYLLYVILGCFIDGMSAMILTLPTVLPILTTLGFDIVWFGVVLTVLIEVGMITPPMGLNLFVIQGISGRSLTDVILGSIPFFLIMLGGIALFTLFPSIILWLPTLLFGS